MKSTSSCPSFKKSSGYFTLVEGFHYRKSENITQNDANFNLKEGKTTRKRVVPHTALQRVPFHSFAFIENIRSRVCSTGPYKTCRQRHKQGWIGHMIVCSTFYLWQRQFDSQVSVSICYASVLPVFRRPL